MGGSVHSLIECPEFADLRTQWFTAGASIPGSLNLHLFSIRPVRHVLTSLLLVLFVTVLKFFPWWSTPGCESL